MAFTMSATQMRTRIRILRPVDRPDTGRYRNPTYENIYPDGRTLRCLWTSAFGTESLQAHSLGINDLATLRMRFDPRITATCVVERLPLGAESAENPAVRYNIVTAPCDIGGAHKWLELKVSRRGGTL